MLQDGADARPDGVMREKRWKSPEEKPPMRAAGRQPP
jgi:hypothetical protein